MHLYTFKWISQPDAAIKYRFIVFRLNRSCREKSHGVRSGERCGQGRRSLSPFTARPIQRCWRTRLRSTGSAWETWTVAAADGVRCDRVRWEINFLLNFETTPFFCVYPVYWNILTMHWPMSVKCFLRVATLEFLYKVCAVKRQLLFKQSRSYLLNVDYINP